MLLNFILGIVPIVFAFFILSIIYPLPELKPNSKAVYDRNGNLLSAYLTKDGIWRIRTNPDEIPAKLKTILLEKEDKYFYYHPGFNPISIIRAEIQNIVSGKVISGASTVTMQVARMMERKERSYFNKIIEIFRALQLEAKYSKDEILEIYLSMIPLGGNIEGLNSGALIYYETPLERLNIAQLIDLILIPNNPNKLRPDLFPGGLLKERRRLSLSFIKRGILTKTDSAIIWDSDAHAERKPLEQKAPHFCLRLANNSGSADIINSSLDMTAQRKTESILQNHIRNWENLGVKNGAVIVIKNETGEVLAYVGSPDFNNAYSSGQVDAVKAVRSPGSTLKPFLYIMRMEKGLLTPKTKLLDVPYDSEGFYAENYDGDYSGFIYADDALRRSLNVPMIRILRETGVNEFSDYLDKLGFYSLRWQQDKLGLSLILGGCGITLEELTHAYSSLPCGGALKNLSYYKISGGKPKEKRIFSESTAFMMTEILSGLNRPDLPNNFEDAVNARKIAYKTGTSYGRRDAWSVGYTSEYTVGIWIGDAKGKGNPELSGAKAAAPILFDIINAISRPGRREILPQPPDVDIRKVCAESGKLPGKYCNNLIDDYYAIDLSSNELCDIHKEFYVAPDESYYYCTTCLENHSHKIKVYEDYPAELLTYWNVIGKFYNAAPPHYPYCPRLFAGDGPKIESPSDNMTYYLSDAKQAISLNASAGIDVKKFSWYIDDEFYKNTASGEKIFAVFEEGRRKVSCVDDKGRMSSVKFDVKVVR
jgi:penicillin-binding protein 1C